MDHDLDDLDALAQVIRQTKFFPPNSSWGELSEVNKNVYRKQAQAVLDFLAEDDQREQMGEDELGQLLYMTRIRYWSSKDGRGWDSISGAKKGPYLAEARAVIEAGQAPKPQGFMIRNARHEVVVDLPAKPARPADIPEYGWIGRDSNGCHIFLKEDVAKSWLQSSQRSGARLWKIRIDWAVLYKLMLVPGDE